MGRHRARKSLEGLIESSPIVSARLSPDGTAVTYVTSNVEAVTGYTPRAWSPAVDSTGWISSTPTTAPLLAWPSRRSPTDAPSRSKARSAVVGADGVEHWLRGGVPARPGRLRRPPRILHGRVRTDDRRGSSSRRRQPCCSPCSTTRARRCTSRISTAGSSSSIARSKKTSASRVINCSAGPCSTCGRATAPKSSARATRSRSTRASRSRSKRSRSTRTDRTPTCR